MELLANKVSDRKNLNVWWHHVGGLWHGHDNPIRVEIHT